MKSLLTLFVVLTIAFDVFAQHQGGPPPPSSDIEREMMKRVEKCSKQAGVDLNTLTHEKMIAENAGQEVKCFHACMSKESGMMNEDGTINKEKMLDFPPDMPQQLKEHLIRELTPCTQLRGDNDCETGFLLFKCLSPPPPPPPPQRSGQ